MSNRLRLCVLGTVLLFICCSAVLADPSIRLQSVTFDPLSKSKANGFAAAQSPIVSAYNLVQFPGPIRPEWRRGVEAAGAEILGYIPDFAYLVRMDTAAAARVRRLGFVRWVGPYLPDYKRSARLTGIPASRLVTMTLSLHSGEDISSFDSELRSLGVTVLARSASNSRPTLRIKAGAGFAQSLAQMEQVEWIEDYSEPKLFNDVARGITKVNNSWTKYGLYGAGQVVAVCDTGLDTGDEATVLTDFRGRVKTAYGLGRAGDWSDPHGHGTHTSGSVLGNGKLSGSSPATHNYATSFAGVAPEAELVMQSVLDDWGGLGGLPADLNELFQQAYDDGARVHSNSWGADVYGYYTVESRDVDQFCWDHKDMVIVFAAGNAGEDSNADGKVDPDSLGSPATAKNCISVGATENLRSTGGLTWTWGEAWPYSFPVPPVSTDRVSNNAEGMAAFSSRGPCDDGRIKPDLCAPGTNIVSCRSSDPYASTAWGVYDSHYLYSGGTSMACPLVAGAAALVREFFLDVKGWPTVSAAMVKAALVNGAKDMTPGQYGAGATQEIARRPDNSQGWGRINVIDSLEAPTSGVLDFLENAGGLVTGGSVTYQYNVNEGDSLRFTMGYTDYPAQAGAGVKLVNDLDMTVVGPTGKPYYPNARSSADHINPVEDIAISSTQTVDGIYTVTITGTNVTTPEAQPFAFVGRMARGVANISGSTMTRSPVSACVGGDIITYTITVKDTGAPSVNTIVTDVLPVNAIYIPESTTLNGAPVADNGGECPLVSGIMVNTPGSSAGVVRSAANAVVKFQVVVADGLGEGEQIVNSARVTADGIPSKQLSVSNRTPRMVRVKPGGSGNGSSWGNAMGSVASAAIGLTAKDEIWVAAGTYGGTIKLTDGIKLYGGFAGNETTSGARNPGVNASVLDARFGGSVITVASGSTEATVIDGLTIKNGKGTKTTVGTQTYYCGGGIYAPNASPTITNNKITANTVLHLGAGIYCTGTTVKIVGNTITSNIARNTGLTGYGGGIYLSAQSGVVSKNTISGNKANHSGGGICCAASAAPSIFNNVITGNGSMDGGGIFCDTGAKPLIASNQLTGNQATHGGGLFCGKNADVTCVNNTFVSNTASPGGGISLYSCKATITNNILAFNSSGIGRAGYGNPTLKNNCVYKSASVNYDGLPAGSTDINKDPLLVDMSRGNFHLKTTSPCINAGYDTVVQSGWLDIDGVARILGGRVDIGADEAR